MTKRFAVTRTISARPDRIWALLTDAAAYPRWNPAVLSIDGTIEAGKKIRLVSIVNPTRTFALTVTEAEAPRRMVWADGMPLGVLSGVRTFTLRPQDDARTEFALVEEVQRAARSHHHAGDPRHDRVVRHVCRRPEEGGGERSLR
jgi:uncharacterized protein YndB with AHSA1/START domain